MKPRLCLEIGLRGLGLNDLLDAGPLGAITSDKLAIDQDLGFDIDQRDNAYFN